MNSPSLSTADGASPLPIVDRCTLGIAVRGLAKSFDATDPEIAALLRETDSKIMTARATSLSRAEVPPAQGNARDNVDTALALARAAGYETKLDADSLGFKAKRGTQVLAYRNSRYVTQAPGR